MNLPPTLPLASKGTSECTSSLIKIKTLSLAFSPSRKTCKQIQDDLIYKNKCRRSQVVLHLSLKEYCYN